jgi:hypothetical protein
MQFRRLLLLFLVLGLAPVAPTRVAAATWACQLMEEEIDLLLTNSNAVVVFYGNDDREEILFMDCSPRVCVGELSDDDDPPNFFIFEIQRDDSGTPVGVYVIAFGADLVGEEFSEGPYEFSLIDGPHESPMACTQMRNR